MLNLNRSPRDQYYNTKITILEGQFLAPQVATNLQGDSSALKQAKLSNIRFAGYVASGPHLL
jgi:hypothetical protein